MSSHDEDRLSGGLRERAADIVAGPADLGQVQARARGIRRRRRVAGGLAGAAVVLVVAVPLAPRLNDVRADRPVPPATLSPSTKPIPLTARDAPRSEAPRIDYQQGRTLHRADGSTVRLPAAYNTLTPYRGGILATESTSDGPEVVELDRDLRVVRRTSGQIDLAVSVDGARVGWATPGDQRPTRTLHLASAGDPSDSTEEMRAPAVDAAEGVTLVGFLDPLGFVYQTFGPTYGVRFLDSQGRDRPLEGLAYANGTSQRAGLVSALDSGVGPAGHSCSVVRDVTGRRGDLWRTCDFTLGRFSPDGRYVLAGPDVEEFGQTAALDSRTGAVVAQWKEMGRGAQPVWESDSTLLTPFVEDRAWHLLRLDVDGGRVSEVADPVSRTGHKGSPWVFTARP